MATIRELVVFFARFTGIPWLVRKLGAFRRVTILVYHDPGPESFARHMAYLANRFNFIPLSRLVDAIHSRNWSTIPPKALVITIDDGHRGNYHLLPVFKEFRIRPTIFLCSKIAGTFRHFWFKDIDQGLAIALQEKPQAVRLAELKSRCDFSPEREFSPESRQSLNGSEIEEMLPYVEFEAHTRYHPILTATDDLECRDEIAGARTDVEGLTRLPCHHFCFPHGDYTSRELEIVRAAGYRSARTMDLGWNGPDTDPFRLKVTGITDDVSVNMLAVQLSGIPMWLRRARLGRFDGTHVTLLFDPSAANR